MQYTSKNQRGVAMKKIIVCMCLALFVGMVYAQEVKYYEDYERGYSGYAGAVYLPRENFDYALNSFSECSLFQVKNRRSMVCRCRNNRK